PRQRAGELYEAPQGDHAAVAEVATSCSRTMSVRKTQKELAPFVGPRIEALAAGATPLRGFASADTTALMKALEQVLTVAPFRHMVTPGGFRMSVAMSNCGRAGWVTDRTGYRYTLVDPTTGRPWPPIPGPF